MSKVVCESAEPIMCDDKGKTFINEILGEMKSQFNRTEIKCESDSSKEEGESPVKKVEEDLVKEEGVENQDSSDREDNLPLEDLKKESAIKVKETCSIKTRSKVNSPSPEKKHILKRSSRRRSRDCNGSILQSAIARKEKSYNESSKPQRLTRQLKPTQKILENLEFAKLERVKRHLELNNGNKPLSENEISAKKPKAQLKSSKRPTRKQKVTDSEADTDSENSKDDNVLGKITRKSRRISISHKKDTQGIDTNSQINQVSSSSTDPSPSSSEDALLAGRLCLCTQNSNFYAAKSKNEVTFCMAVDNIDGNFLGCSRIADVENTCLLRSSQRVPYQILCEMHKNRLLRHNCCPSCGVFCTQGNFLKCEENHLYHHKCNITIGAVSCCPHCGISKPSQEVTIKLHCTKKPILLPVQKLHYPSAKMNFTPINDQSSFDVSSLLPQDIFQDLNEFDLEQEFSENDLLEAIRDEDFKKLAAIIASDSFDLHFKISDFNDGTLLHYAAQNGLLVVCHLLVLANLDINEFDKEQNTPLMLAISCEKNDVIQYLIKTGASISIKGTDGMTCLHIAAKYGNLFATKLILQTAFNSIRNFINCQDDGGWTPLVWACEHDRVEIVKYLINQGADPLLRDVEHNEALHWASFSGNTEIIHLLLNEGCDVNTTNAHGEAPLHIAAREDQYNCIIVLLARGADVSLVNKNNETALECVPEDGDSYGVIALNVKLQSVEGDHKKRKTLLSNDISKGKELNPIQCVNKVDDEPEPTDYVYITKSYLNSDETHIENKISSLRSCNCRDRCISDECGCGNLSGKCWYDEEGKLTTDFSFADSPVIFECNEFCSCNAITCRNRLVQKGLSQRFQLYKTESIGWGVKTLRAIPKGSFVCEYVGEILIDSDADEREDDSYVFDISIGENESYCVDASHYGNICRFINHSCSPNLHPVKVFVEHQDIRFPKIVLFALRDITAEEELNFDYGQKFWLIKCKSFTCQCKTPDCKYSADKIEETLRNYQQYEEL